MLPHLLSTRAMGAWTQSPTLVMQVGTAGGPRQAELRRGEMVVEILRGVPRYELDGGTYCESNFAANRCFEIAQEEDENMDDVK